MTEEPIIRLLIKNKFLNENLKAKSEIIFFFAIMIPKYR